MSYEDLPNIHFTYKINRNFPKYNKVDYDDLMDRVIIPIYPDETERKYNAHIKSRELAGCYQDKNGMVIRVLVIQVKEQKQEF